MLHRVAAAVPIVVLALSGSAFAQNNPRGEAKVTLGGKSVVIEYGRPSLKGRDMLGKAAVGQEWRMGADTSTTLKTDADLAFGSVKVPKGNYVLRARKVGEADWVLKVERPDGGAVVAEIPLQATTLDKSVEVFTIDLVEDKGQGVFRMSWGNRALAARLSAS